VRRLLAIVALLCASLASAAALDFPQLDGRVIDEAGLLDAAAKRTLENKLANLEAHTSKQFLVVTLASARGMTVDDYGLALRRHWNLDPNGRRVMLIVSPSSGRSVIQHDTALSTVLTDAVTQRIFDRSMTPRFNAGDFPGGTLRAADEVIDVLEQASTRPRIAENGAITVPATAEFPALSSRVVDDAEVLDAATRAALRAKLAAHEVGTSNQIVVVTVKSLHGSSVEDYANRLFRHWRLGQRGRNNGVLLLHAPTERKVRIEVGYGLEGMLTDAIAKTIIQNAITPRFKVNDFAGGMTRGVDDIIKVLSGDAEAFKRIAEPRQSSWVSKLLETVASPFGLIFLPVVFLIILQKTTGFLRPLQDIPLPRGRTKKRRKRSWYAADDRSSSDSSSYSSSSSSWDSSSSSSSDSFSGGGGDSGGGGSSGDY
jgi:uncharacterized protein